LTTFIDHRPVRLPRPFDCILDIHSTRNGLRSRVLLNHTGEELTLGSDTSGRAGNGTN